MVGFTLELNSGGSEECQEPVPDVESEKYKEDSEVAKGNETHESHILIVRGVVPDADLSAQVVADAQLKPKDEQQEKALVVQPNTVVYPGTVVVH